MIIDSLDTTPKKTPSKIIQIRIIKKELIKITKLAAETEKKGINGINPPKNGELPFTIETTILAKLSAFS